MPMIAEPAAAGPPARARDAGDTTTLQRGLARNILDLLRERGAQPGERVSRLALAEALGVSRTPIGAAMSLLEDLGAVRTEGRSVLVRSLDVPAPLPEESAAENGSGRLLVAIARGRADGTIPAVVSERQLSVQLAASRGAVAQALAQLADAGVATRNRGNGWRFTAGFACERERAASYRFRLLIEPSGLLEPDFALPRNAAERMRRDHSGFLDRPWDDARAVDFFRMNAEFHLGLAEASGNRFIAAAVAQQNRARMLTNFGWRVESERVRASVREHLDIMDALEAGHRDRAALLMRLHLMGAMALPHPDEQHVPQDPAPAGR